MRPKPAIFTFLKVSLPVILIHLCLVSPVRAHPHPNEYWISENTARSIASATLRKLAFRDMGYQVGKLGPAWARLDSREFGLLETADGFFIVTVHNPRLDQLIYLYISRIGEVQKVEKLDE